MPSFVDGGFMPERLLSSGFPEEELINIQKVVCRVRQYFNSLVIIMNLVIVIIAIIKVFEKCKIIMYF